MCSLCGFCVKTVDGDRVPSSSIHNGIQEPHCVIQRRGVGCGYHSGYLFTVTHAECRLQLQGSVFCTSSNDQQFPSTMEPNEPPQHTTCSWRDEGGTICGKRITKNNCGVHLACHGIKRMSSDHTIKCRACIPPKSMKRESILRHFVEVHIGIKRKPGRRKDCSAHSSALVHRRGVREDHY